MARLNTLLRIDPPAGIATVPWTWDYTAIGTPNASFPANPMQVRPKMLQSDGTIVDARNNVGETFVPVNVIDLFRGNNSVVVRTENTRLGRLRATLAPAQYILVSQTDRSGRDANLLLEANEAPFVMTLTLRASSTIMLLVTFEVTRDEEKHGPGPAVELLNNNYKIFVTYQSHVATGIPGVQNDSYFDEDPAILDVVEALAFQPFSIYGEIFQSDSAFDITLGEDASVQASATADVRIRYDARIEAGSRATFDGNTYVIVSVEVEDRRRFLRLSLSRLVT